MRDFRKRAVYIVGKKFLFVLEREKSKKAGQWTALSTIRPNKPKTNTICNISL